MFPKKVDLIEGLIVFAFITGVLLPVRLFFVTYVSDNWFGSFGIISAISISMIILAKKGKMGKLGQMIERQIEKYHRGKNWNQATGYWLRSQVRQEPGREF